MKREIILYICLLGLFLIPIISSNNIWTNYGQEAIGIITLTETISDSGISLEKTGEVMLSSNQPIQSSSGGGSGGGGTTIIKEKEVIKIVPQEESEDKEQGVEEKEVSGEKSSGSSWITGGVIGASLLSGGQLVFVIIILCGTFIIFIIVRYKTIRLKKKLK